MLLSCKSTYIILISKVKGARTQEQYRPISLCCTLYKIVTRILVNRLKGVIDKMISPEHAAFVPGRSISDNILLAQELAYSVENARAREGLMLAKLDMERAYDRMDWSFLVKSPWIDGLKVVLLNIDMRCWLMERCQTFFFPFFC